MPVYFTQGFNPRPRISLPVPRSVGIGSWDDRARIEMEENIDPAEAMEKLRGFVPFELEFKRAWMTEPGRLERVNAIEWQIDLDGLDPETISSRIGEILAGPVNMTRRAKKTDKEYSVDFRPLILEMSRQENFLRAKIAYTPQGSIRPGELLEILHLPKKEFLGRMTRIKTYWN